MMALRGHRSVNSASKSLGLNTSTLQSVLARNSIGRKTAERIADKWGFSADWIERGWGPMRPGIEPQPDPFRESGGERRPARESAAERIRALWEHSEIGSFSAFAEACGLAVERLQEILDTDGIDEDTARSLAARLGISPLWIYRGEGPFQLHGHEIEGFRGAEPEAVPGENGLAPAPTEDPSLIYVPKASSKLSAGGGTIPDEEWSDQFYAFREDWLRGRVSNPRNVFLMEVSGDSMERDIKNGDMVLIDRGDRMIEEGNVYAIGVGGAIQIKKLEPLATGKILVKSLNPQYHSYQALETELRIIGRVKWLGREL